MWNDHREHRADFNTSEGFLCQVAFLLHHVCLHSLVIGCLCWPILSTALELNKKKSLTISKPMKTEETLNPLFSQRAMAFSVNTNKGFLLPQSWTCLLTLRPYSDIKQTLHWLAQGCAPPTLSLLIHPRCCSTTIISFSLLGFAILKHKLQAGHRSRSWYRK